MRFVMEVNLKDFIETRKDLEKRWGKYNKMTKNTRKVKRKRNGTKIVMCEFWF